MDKRNIQPKYIDLMQFTRLTDRNGKEIYDGDVVNNWEYFGISKKEIPLSHSAKGEIDWRLGTFHIRGKNQHGQTVSHTIVSVYPNLEVIGNIYQNPN